MEIAGSKPNPTAATTSSHDAAHTAAEQESAAAVVKGAYFLVGDNIQMRAQIVDARNGRVLDAIDGISSPKSSRFELLDTLQQHVMGAVAVRLEAGVTGEFRLPCSKAPRYDAYRESVEGFRLVGPRPIEAIARFQRAARLDPDSWMPQFGEALAYENLGAPEKAAAIVDRLDEDRDRLGRPEQLYVDWLRDEIEGRKANALARLRELEKLAPRDGFVKFSIGRRAYRLNRLKESVQAFNEFRTMAALHPAAVPYGQSPVAQAARLEQFALHLLGQHDAELALAREVASSRVNSQAMPLPRARAFAALGRMADLDGLIAETVASPGTGNVLREAALELRAHGHRQESLVFAGKEVAWLRERGAQTGTPQARYALALALYTAERWGEARELMTKLARESPDTIVYQRYLGTLAARLGDRTEAVRISQALEHLTGRYLRGAPSYHRAFIAAVLGDREQALVLLQRAFAEGYDYDIELHQAIDLESLRGRASLPGDVETQGVGLDGRAWARELPHQMAKRGRTLIGPSGGVTPQTATLLHSQGVRPEMLKKVTF